MYLCAYGRRILSNSCTSSDGKGVWSTSPMSGIPSSDGNRDERKG